MGLKTDIVLTADGAGTLNMEYRISGLLAEIGALDGNAAWPAVPVGRADFERTLDGLEDLRLLSFSEGEEGGDLIYRAAVGFPRLEAVLPLLDRGGRMLSLARGEKQSLLVRLRPEGKEEALDGELLALAEEHFRGYSFSMSLSAPSAVEIRVTGGDFLVDQGKGKAGFSVPMDKLMSPGQFPVVEFVF
jgi:hypothetical protein